MRATPSDETLTRFGVNFGDEGPHAFDPAVEWWNESWFWDRFDADGRVAGHRRALVRGRRADGPPLLGWVESNRFLGKP